MNLENNKDEIAKQEEDSSFDLFGNPIVEDSKNAYVQKTKPNDLSGSIKTEYVLEIHCNDEKEQEKMFNELKERGFKCKVLTL